MRLDRGADVIVGMTGASGFVGTTLTKAIERAGWAVVPLGRREERRYDLDGPIGEECFRGLDVLVHAAYAPGSDNLRAARATADAARAAGVGRLVFISTFAAAPDAASAYARDKYAAESSFAGPRDIVIRPGLVAGNGGLYGAIRRWILRLRIAPAFDRGDQPVYLVYDEELARAIVALLARDARGTFVLASGEPIEFRALCSAIAGAAGTGVRFVPLPSGPVVRLMRLVETLGLRLPVSSQTVLGIANLRRAAVPSYAEIGFSFATPSQTVLRVEDGVV